MPTIKQEQFPLIKFEKRAVEDRNASIEAGRRITKDIDIVYIKQIGEKDETERVAQEWLDQLYQKASGDNGMKPSIPMEWHEFAVKSYENWKKGYEAPLNGTPVREWAVLTPSQVQNLHSMKTYTIEEVANWSENAMAMYGMGGRELREKAKLWLASGDAKAEQISALQAENKDLKEALNRLMSEVKDLREELREEKPRGRAKKEAEAA